MSLIERLAGHTLCLHLAPQELVYALRKGGRMGAAGRIAVDNPAGHWQAPLAALEQFLGRGDRPGAALPLRISLASRWCPAALAPWSEALLSEAGAARFLHAQMAALYGDAARAWRIVGDDAPYGQPRLVGAVDAALLQALQDTAGAHGHACHGVESLLTVAWRAIAAGKPPAFALVEPDRLTLAAVGAGRIVALQTQSCPADWRAELARAWQRWSLRAPELAGLAGVAVVDLSGAPQGELAAPFRPAAAALTRHGPVHLMRQSAWA
ncbi:hypothetical protein [Janthinobacterium sp.]|uniref:hypothetical protein n=1 Tax=Janthinobacterium sp. TaxID=1871054 RepID=UPI00293D7AFC|nr:hypothetical protein [Janthinobacterium sp.]